MKIAILIISIPISFIFFVLGMLFLKNKLDCRNYGIDVFFPINESEEEKKRQMMKNKIGGCLFVGFAVLLILIPIIFM